MQEESKNYQSFFDRTSVLARRLGVNVSDLPVKIEVSASMFHSYRSGKYPISDKVWRKLAAAEKAAGVSTASGDFANNEGNPKENPGIESEFPAGLEARVAGFEARVAALEAENAALREGLAEIFERLRPLVSGPRPKKYSSEEPSGEPGGGAGEGSAKP